MKRNAVQRDTGLGILVLFDLDAIRVVRTHFVQRHQMRHDQADQHERNRDHVQREQAIERGVRRDVVTLDPDHEIRTDAGNRAEQRDDHLRPPVRHLAPGQHVTAEGLGHQADVDQAAEDPDQFARFAMRAVHQGAEHVQIHDDEERRGPGRMQVADDVAPGHIAHDVFDRIEGFRRRRLVVHDQEDAGQQLVDQHQHRQRAEVVPEVEVLRRVVLGDVILPHLRERKAIVDPAEEAGRLVRIGHDGHQAAPPWVSSPTTTSVSVS